MAFDRAAALRNAEKLLRLGKLDAAIAEYVRVVAEQPRDWNTANALGDLYVRTGQIDLAVGQFSRIADGLVVEGFLPRANAVYKKILKLQPAHEHALLQAAEIAVSLGLLADARAQFETAIARRQTRGDVQGVAEIRVRLGSLDGADIGTRVAAAMARVDLGDSAQAARDLTAIADQLVQGERTSEAIELLQQAGSLVADDGEIRRRLALLYAGTENVDRAVEVASAAEEYTGLDHDSRVGLAEALMVRGESEAGLSMIRELLLESTEHGEPILRLAAKLGEHDLERGFSVVDLVASNVAAGQGFSGAVSVLDEWCARHSGHIPALMRLVEMSVDGGLDEPMYRAQAQLADAYTAAGMLAQARFIAEDLVAHAPDDLGHVERLRRVLELEGEADPDTIIAERRAGESTPAMLDEVAVLEESDLQMANGAGTLESLLQELEADVPPAAPERIEVDLSLDLDDILRPAAVSTLSPVPVAASGDIDKVFEHLRGEASRRPSAEEAQQNYERALALRASGDINGSIDLLQAVARDPRLRFAAASMLARIFRELDELHTAVEWYERGVEAPAPSAEEAHALLYDLADALESEIELARALAVFLELQSEAGGYRDVAARIERLTKLQVGE